MSDDIKIGIKASDGGSIDNLTGKAEKLRNTLRDASEAASKIRVPSPTMAARQGVAASQPSTMSQSASVSQPKSAAYRAASGPGNTASDTNLSRGIAGQTGASGRDFAAQAQGLGGLVHVYATFAANLFAVSAAFGALSKAADTTNMVKGLDQLGAQSGRALGTLSKQLIAVSDGALSMRDAMTATALATAGGMSNTNMIRMTQVAKNASLALGRDMTDSMDRLTKGIVKIQPELLDELGIMARVIPSQEAYARQLGKSTSSLTDFEKKQAFANAVLDEGEKKFGAINIDANPYSKLSASIQNLGQSFLALVNSPVGAFASMLADNSVLLGLALAGVAKTLLNQAIPGLRAYKISMADLAKRSKDYATETRASSNQEVSDLTDFLGKKDAAAGKAAENAYKLAYNSKRKIRQLDESVVGSEIISIAKKSPFDLTPGEISAIKAKQQELSKSALATEQSAAKELGNLYNSTNRAKAKAIEIADAAAEESGNKDKINQKELAKLKSRTSDINQRYHLDNIKAITAETQASKGMFAAFGEMNKQLSYASGGMLGKGKVSIGTGTFDKSGKEIMEEVNRLNVLQRAAETTSGSYNILKNAASGVMSKLSSFAAKYGEIGAIIAAVVATIDLAVDALGNNGKEMAIFSKSLDTLKESGDNVARTLEAIQAKDPLERMSIASTAAKANSFMGVADSIDAVIKAGDKAKAKANWMDDLVDFAKRIYGGDIATKTRDSIVSSVSDSIDLLASNDKLGSKFKANMMNILKIPKLDDKSITDALKAMDPKDIPQLYKKVKDSVSEASREFNNFSTTLQTFKAATDTAVRASQDFNLTIMSSDLMFKLGLSLVAVAASLQKVGEEGQSSKDALQDLLKDSAKLSLLSPDMASKLIGLSNEFTNNSIIIKANADNVAMLQKRYDDASAAVTEYNKSLSSIFIPGVGTELVVKKEEAGKALGEGKRFQNQQEASQRSQEVKASELIAQAQYSAFQKGSKLIEVSLGNIAQKIALGVDRATATSLTGLQALYANMDFVKRDAALAKEQLESAYKSYVAMQELRTAVEINSATLAVSNEPDPDKKAQLQVQLDGLKIFAEAMKAGPAAIQKLLDKALSGSNPNVAPRSRVAGATAAERAAGVQAGPLAGATASLVSKLAQEDAKVQEADSALLYSRQVALAAVRQKEMLQESNLDKLSSDRLGIMQGLLQIQDETLYASKQQLDNESDLKKQAADKQAIIGKILGLEDQIAKVTNVELLGKLKNQKIEEELALTNLKITQSKETQNKALQAQIGLMNIQLAISQREYNLTLAKDSRAALNATTLSDINQAEFQAQVTLGVFSDEYKAKKEASLAIDRATLDLSTAQLIKDREIVKVQEDADKKKLPAGFIKPGESGYDRNAIDINRGIQKDADKAIAQAQIEKDKNQIIYDGKVKILGITEITAIKQAKESEILKDQAFAMEGLVMKTASLADAFGTVGEAVGKTTEIIAAMADQDLNYLRKKSDLEDIISKGKSAAPESAAAKDAIEAQNNLTKLEKQNTRDTLKNDQAILASSKKMFGEKTLAYIALDTLQKISSARQMALQLKDLAFSLGILTTKVTAEGIAETEILGIKIASASAKVGADAPAILSSFSTLGPPGYIMGAALVAALLAMAGGGESPPSVDMTGKTSADKQAVAGTGQAYVQSTAKDAAKGTLMLADTGGGVFGDSSAKSASIANSLEILASNSIEGLDYDDKLLQAFKGLADSLTTTSQAIYNIPGLRKGGTGFGTQPGTETTNAGGLFGGGFLNSVFGGKTTANTSIAGAGINVTGSLQNLIDETEGSITAYKDVLTQFHKDGGWFGSDQDWTTLSREAVGVGAEVRKGLSDVFKNAKEVFTEVGATAGVGTEQINAAFKSINFSGIQGDIDTMGLTGQAALDQLNAVVGAKLDETARLLFGGFDKFKKFGEGYLETVVRVTDGNNKVDQALRSMGNSFDVLGKFDISEAMIKAAGGLEKFMEQSSFFKDAFLTDAQRLAPVQKSVSEQLTKLHVSTSISREDFAKLVNAQDLSTDAGQKMYQSLMDLAPGLDQVRKAEEAAATAAKALANSALDLEIKIYQLKGSNEALNLTRQKELDAMDESLRPRQRYINALTDEIALRDKLKSAYDTTNTSLTTSIKSLQDYKTALLGGTSSTLSPAEKYAQSKAIFEQTSAAAKATITTSSSDAEIKARDDAVANLSKASDSFLANSKVMNASGTQYAADFAAVGTAIDATSSALSTQQTEVQQQLGFLDKIAVATDTTAQLLEKYLAAVGITTVAQASATASGSVAAGVPYAKYASGGLASGMSLVGEQGPELVDFANPGRVYSNSDSKNLFNNDALIAEVKALREEVTKLREDQKEQTGHLIATTFTANARNAEAINNGNVQALNQQNWKARSGVTVV